MIQTASTRHHLIPPEFDIKARICEKDAADKKEDIFLTLRSAIYGEYRKYAKAKKLKSAGPSFTHARCITFEFDQPKPPYGKRMTYRLLFGPDGVIVSPVTLNPDPEFAPFLEPVNLSKVENDYFDPADVQPRKRRLTALPAAESADVLQTAGGPQQTPVIGLPEFRFITASCAPTVTAQGRALPFLRFGGQYLEKFGFTIGAPVTILLEQNKITLTVPADETASRHSA
jgi:hypothetical protein